MPIGFYRTSVVACFFMLRDIELSTMLYSSVALDISHHTVTIHLPATKTDPMALSCERSWGCVCLDGEASADTCPFHAALAHTQDLRARFGDKVDSDTFPFAPSQTGEVMEKVQVVDAIQLTAQAAGLPTRGADGKLIFTGHIWRIMGSRHMVRNGVQVPIAMLMARWDSNAVLRYIKDAPLITITGEFKRGVRALKIKAIEDKHQEFKGFSKKALADLQALRSTVEHHEQELAGMGATLSKLKSAVHPIYVISDKYRKWHVVPKFAGVAVSLWKARCGWRYGASKFERRSKPPAEWGPDERCPRCFDLPNISEDSD